MSRAPQHHPTDSLSGEIELDFSKLPIPPSPSPNSRAGMTTVHNDIYPIPDADAEVDIDEHGNIGADATLQEQMFHSNNPATSAFPPPSSSLSLKKSRSQQFQQKMMDVIRGKTDEGPLVEDYILETMDFDRDEDRVHEENIEKRGAIHRQSLQFLKFFMTILIAFVTAMLMFVVGHSVEVLQDSKVEVVLGLVEQQNGAGAYFALLGLTLLFTGAAGAAVAILAPHAKGGGVPYVLAYLNGTNVMEYFTLRIVMVKAIALVFTIAGGLTLGMEGPFVYIGGGVAAVLCQGFDLSIPFFPKFKSYARVIRSIKEERVFMAGGMAAGLAVAFDAPIAGVLFALEGATAFLSVPVLIRIFGCAMFAAFFNNLGHTNFSSYIKNHNLLPPSQDPKHLEYAWNIVEVFPFLVIGVVGGVVGAAATWINIKISVWRHHHLNGNTWKDIAKQIAEVLLFALATLTLFFILPYVFPCRQVHELCDAPHPNFPERCRQAHCPDGFYSEAATIVFSSANQISALVFDRALSYDQEFHVGPLIVYGIIYWGLVALVYGMSVPGGLFVPSIVIGGMYGRVIGIFCLYMFPSSSVNPGVYSLLGAASMLGGFTRLALPVVIMLAELTGDATYLLPMMLCSAVGKFVSDYLFPPLYPQHMALEKIPSLTDKLNPIIAKLAAKDIMLPASNLTTVTVIEKLGNVKDKLTSSKRIVFPVISNQGGHLAGLISRRNLMSAIKVGKTYKSLPEALSTLDKKKKSRVHRPSDVGATQDTAMPDWREDRRDYSSTVSRSTVFEDYWLNLSPFMDAGAVTARAETPAKRLAALFRRVGLSHVCVCDKHNRFLGLITRRHLITPPAHLMPPPKDDHHHGDEKKDNDAHKAEEPASTQSQNNTTPGENPVTVEGAPPGTTAITITSADTETGNEASALSRRNVPSNNSS